MTGTAETEAAEFDKIYKLEVLVIPTNRPLIRVENPDVVYRTEPEKFDAVVRGDPASSTRRASRCWWARSRSRSPRQLSTLLQEGGHPARGAERQVPRARGRDRRAGGPLRRGDDRDQHGRPRHRHHPRRRARPPRQGGAGRASRREEARPRPRRPRGPAGRARPGEGRDGGRVQARAAAAQAQRRDPQGAGAPLPGPDGLVRSRPPVGAGGTGPRPRGLRGSPATSTPGATCPAPPRRRSPRPSTPRSRTRWTSWPSTP